LQKFRSIEDDHRRIFAGMLTALDDAVGQILNTLEATGTARNTWLVFLSDNGGPTRELTSSNLPLRGEKGSMYEGALRVPFMMKWPNRLPVGQVYTQPISSADLFATAATMAEAKFEHSIDGRDLIPFVTGQATGQPHTEFFWRQGERSALRNNDWKIIRSMRNGKVQWELYDLAQDLSETNDLSAVNPAQLMWMQSRWQAFNAQMREPLF
jgi:arylsulfatase B